MANEDLLLYEANNVNLISGVDPFADYNDAEDNSVGSVFEVTAPPLVVAIRDDDAIFDESDGDQEMNGGQVINGQSYSDGEEIDPEYTYTIRPVGATDDSQDIQIHAVEADGDHLGFVASRPLALNTSYRVQSVDSEGPEVSYDNIYVCFTPDVQIDTPAGPRAAGDIRPGDYLMTQDAGPQRVLWTGQRTLPSRALTADPRKRPVRVRAGAFGPGVPARDMILSPQHRVLIRSAIAWRMYGSFEVLAPVCQLTDLDGVDRIDAPEGVTYIHVLLSRHHVLTADGARAESLFLGPETEKILDVASLGRIAAVAPEMATERHAMAPARPFATGRRLARLLARHVRNDKPLWDPDDGVLMRLAS